MRRKDLIGTKKNNLTAYRYATEEEVREAGLKRSVGEYFKCKCDCGEECITHYNEFSQGKKKSCGCLNRIVPKFDSKGQFIGHFAAIYLWTNLINEKKYVGRSKDVQKRIWEHLARVEKPEKVLYRAFDKYGVENFSITLLESWVETPPRETLVEREQYWIDFYNSREEGYNVSTSIGGGFYSEEHREKCTKIIQEQNEKQKGLNHPRTFMTEEFLDLIFGLAMRGAPGAEVWELYESEIKDHGISSKASFTQLYCGQNWKDRLPEGWGQRPVVYTNSQLWGEQVIWLRRKYLENSNIRETISLFRQEFPEKCYVSDSVLRKAIEGKTYGKIKID